MILEEFDENKIAVINAFDEVKKIEGFPKIAVSCFAKQTFDRLLDELDTKEISCVTMANMRVPIYKTTYKGVDIALFMAYVGSAGCVGLLEDIFAMGLEKLIIFGTCGVLDSSIKDCSIIIPSSAVRDEGTSYHYVPVADEIEINKKYTSNFINILENHKFKYTIGKAWTTDAIYRETRDKVQKRKNQGCICVDMECSAVAALADFREKEVFHFFYAADNLDAEVWDERSLSNDANLVEKDKITRLAMELALDII